MILLPRGNPVKEGIDPGKVHLPEAMQKLQKGNFTGYLRFDTTQGTGILIFDTGRLISALFESGLERSIAYDALLQIFQRSLAGNATLDIYRLSSELAMSVHALLHGTVLYKGQEVQLLDIRGLLGRMKEDRISGCLRIYTQDHIALIFYRNGDPLGFFHDGSTDIEKSAESSLSVAKLPGAKIDVLTSEIADEANLADLLVSGDISGLWLKAREQVVRDRRSREEQASRESEQREKDRRQRMVSLLKGIAEKNLGKIGASLVEKEFEKTMAEQEVLSEAALGDFYQRLGKASKLVAGPSKVKLMVDEMQRAIKTLLKAG